MSEPIRKATVADEHSTFPREAPGLRTIRRARLGRRVGMAVFLAIIVMGLANLFGVRSATVTDSGGGFDLRVTYASISRSGLATPLTIDVVREGGFDGPVVLGITSAYLAMFDQNAITPPPSGASTSGDLHLLTFDPPQGERLTVVLDARLEPAAHFGRPATTSVYEGGSPVATVHYFTRVMP